MEWIEYYQDRWSVRRFGKQTDGYYQTITDLARVCPQTLDPSQPQIFVLGGFHPHNGTVEDFAVFCQQIHSHPQDLLIFLDSNSYPLSCLNPTKQRTVQARLEQLPFDHNIDLLFLDFTCHFMDDSQIRRFAKTAGLALKRNGLTLASTFDLASARLPSDLLSDISGRKIHPPQEYYRSPEELIELISPLDYTPHSLRPVAVKACPTFSVVALARWDSDYSMVFSGP